MQCDAFLQVHGHLHDVGRRLSHRHSITVSLRSIHTVMGDTKTCDCRMEGCAGSLSKTALFDHLRARKMAKRCKAAKRSLHPPILLRQTHVRHKPMSFGAAPMRAAEISCKIRSSTQSSLQAACCKSNPSAAAFDSHVAIQNRVSPISRMADLPVDIIETMWRRSRLQRGAQRQPAV